MKKQSAQVEMTEIVRPAIRNIHIKSSGQLDSEAKKLRARMEAWGWVDIYDLMACLTNIYFSVGIEKVITDQATFFEEFSGLQVNNDGTSSLTWLNRSSYTISGELPQGAEWEHFCVPSGYANGLMTLAREGVVKVTSKFISTGVFGDGGKEISVHQAIGHTHDEKEVKIHFMGGDKVYYVDRS